MSNINTDKMMLAYTFSAHISAFERKTRRWGASSQQVSNHLETLSNDLQSAQNQSGNAIRGLIKDAVKEALNPPVTEEAKPASKKGLAAQLLDAQSEVKRLKQAIK